MRFNYLVTMLDPRTKLLLAICYAVLVIISGQLTSLIIKLCILLLFVLVIGKSREYLRWLRLVLPMAIFFGAVTWWSADPKVACTAAFNLLAIASVFFVFFSTTIPEDLGNSLVKMGMPYHVGFIMSASLQFVPVISRKVRNVADAQRARGIPLEPGWRALRNYPAFLGPILIQAFRLAEELAESMEARGFGRSGRTFFKEYRLRSVDWIALAIGLLLLIVCIVLKI